MTAAGMKLDDWQEYVLWAWHDVDGNGNWAASEAGLLVSRQNGKSEDLIAFDLVRLFLFPMPDKRRRTVLHTAHEVKTATESFEKLASIIASSDRLMSMVDHVYTANGKEAILLKRRPGQLLGDRVRFIARSKGSGRGFGAADIVYDEAQDLSTQARSALTYTQSTIPNRQEIFAGTVPSAEDDGEVFEGLRDRGRSGLLKAPRTIWQEWSPAGADDPKLAATIDINDRDVWRQGIPAMGLWIPPATVAEQVARATDRDELLRERFSVWPNRAEEATVELSELDIAQWKNNALAGGKLGPKPVIALAVGRGGKFTTISAASRTAANSLFVEHKKTQVGTLWVPDYLKKLKAELNDALIVLDAKNASSLITELEGKKIKYLSMNLDELAGAHSLFIELSNAGLVRHRGQEEVTASFEFATTRALGRAGFTWEPSQPTKPISHAQSATWAVWGVTKAEASQPKKPAAVRGYA